MAFDDQDDGLRERRFGAGGWILLVVLALGFAVAFRGLPGGGTPAIVDAPVPASEDCDPAALPKNGFVETFGENAIPEDPTAALEFENQHGDIVVVYLTPRAATAPLLALYVWPGEKAQTLVPPGRYTVRLRRGGQWCNSKVGMVNAHRWDASNPVDVGPNQILALSLQAAKDGRPEGLYADVRGRPPEVRQAPSAGVIELTRQITGHYEVAGRVNDMPVTFVVDTGASLTSLSHAAAYAAGVRSCTPRMFYTANGQVEGCSTLIPRLSFGEFVLENVEVGVLPNQTQEGLLGMNVLNAFHIEQRGGVMRIMAGG